MAEPVEAPDVRFRVAAEADVPTIVALVESAYRGNSSRVGWTTEADLLDGQRTDADEVRSLLPSILLAERDGAVVACCHVEQRADHGYFGMYAVQPGLQGSGTGSALLAEAERRARATGALRMEMTVLAVRSELIAFYERRGYALTGETRPFPYGDERFGRPRRDDLHFVVLSKAL